MQVNCTSEALLKSILYLSHLFAGLPTLTVVVCGISGVYGKYSLELRDDNSRNSTAQM